MRGVLGFARDYLHAIVWVDHLWLGLDNVRTVSHLPKRPPQTEARASRKLLIDCGIDAG